MWTLPHYLEFEIIRPTADNKAHITISFEHFDTSIPGVKGSRTYGYSSPPRPHDADGVKIVFYPSFDLPLRKYGKLAILVMIHALTSFYMYHVSSFRILPILIQCSGFCFVILASF